MKAGLHYNLDERYDTSDKLSEPSFDITSELGKIKVSDEIQEKTDELKAKILQLQNDYNAGKTEIKGELDKTRAELLRHGFIASRRFDAMHDDRAKLVNWNAAVGRKEAEIDRWRKEKNIDPDQYKKVKDKLIGELKAQALWAEKQVAVETAAHKDGYKIGKKEKKGSKMAKPKVGEKNAKMKSLSMH